MRCRMSRGGHQDENFKFGRPKLPTCVVSVVKKGIDQDLSVSGRIRSL